MMRRLSLGLAVLGLAAALSTAHAQDRLPNMPGYEQHRVMQQKLAGSVKLATVNVSWNDPTGRSFEYTVGAAPERYRFNIARKTATGIKSTNAEATIPPITGQGRQASDLSARGAYAREHSYVSRDGN